MEAISDIPKPKSGIRCLCTTALPAYSIIPSLLFALPFEIDARQAEFNFIIVTLLVCSCRFWKILADTFRGLES